MRDIDVAYTLSSHFFVGVKFITCCLFAYKIHLFLVVYKMLIVNDTIFRRFDV